MLGADVPVYNIPGVTASLNFTPEALAGIFLGKITKWNDPAIAEANPGVKLPSAQHRGRPPLRWQRHDLHLDGLSFQGQHGMGRRRSVPAQMVNWPVGLGGKGNEGVAGSVKQTPNSIGYVELTYAIQNKMTYGKVKNAAGDFR